MKESSSFGNLWQAPTARRLAHATSQTSPADSHALGRLIGAAWVRGYDAARQRRGATLALPLRPPARRRGACKSLLTCLCRLSLRLRWWLRMRRAACSEATSARVAQSTPRPRERRLLHASSCEHRRLDAVGRRSALLALRFWRGDAASDYRSGTRIFVLQPALERARIQLYSTTSRCAHCLRIPRVAAGLHSAQDRPPAPRLAHSARRLGVLPALLAALCASKGGGSPLFPTPRRLERWNEAWLRTPSGVRPRA